jgi:hypothetical protein
MLKDRRYSLARTKQLRRQISRIVDSIPESDLPLAYAFLRRLSINKDPEDMDEWVADDSPMTEEEKLAAEKAMQEYEAGECVPWGDIRDEV